MHLRGGGQTKKEVHTRGAIRGQVEIDRIEMDGIGKTHGNTRWQTAALRKAWQVVTDGSIDDDGCTEGPTATAEGAHSACLKHRGIENDRDTIRPHHQEASRMLDMIEGRLNIARRI